MLMVPSDLTTDDCCFRTVRLRCWMFKAWRPRQGPKATFENLLTLALLTAIVWQDMS